ncbi:MAG: IS21-like element helper ATPase IstB [Bdellovibrionia bacterium]
MSTTQSMQVHLELNLKTLKLPTMLRSYQKISEDAAEEGLTCEQYLYRLTDTEVEKRREHKVRTLIQHAKFPLKKLLSEFKFEEAPSVSRQTFIELAEGHFLADAKNILMYGPPGTGKSHLAIGLARELCIRQKKVIFFTACDLTQRLIREKNNLRLSEFLKKLNRYDLICIDELGFIPFERAEADLLFQCFSACYEKTSILVTTNLVFSEWDEIFKDAKATTAAIDRLIHHSYLFEMISDESYRAKEARKNMDPKRQK